MKAKISRHLVLISSVVIIFAGFLLLMLPSLTSGLGERCISNQCGIFFTNIFRARDDLWHMSLAQVAFDTYPFRMPVFYGEALRGYHFLYSYILMLVTKTGLSVLSGYYLALPIVWFIIYTSFTVVISRALFSDKRAVPIFLFFSYFSSNLTFVLSLKNTGSFWNDIGWFSNQPAEYMINPTLALSILLLQAIIYVLLRVRSSIILTIILTVLTFLLWGAKFYGGVIGISFIWIFLATKTYNKHLSLKSLLSILFATLLSSAIAVLFFYNPFVGTKTGGIFSLEPFKTIHPIIEDPGLFQILKLARLRYKLYEHPYIFAPILLVIEIFSLALYIFIAFGTRMLSVALLFSKTHKSTLNIAIFASAIFSIIFAALFTQKGGDWFNTVQFLGYGQFLLQIALSLFVISLLKFHDKRTNALIVSILVLTLAGSLNSVVEYGKDHLFSSGSQIHKLFQPKVYVSSAELDALSYLSKLPSGVTYTFPFTPIYDERPIKQLWKTNDTALVAALGKQQLYEANLQQLDITGIDHKKRTQLLKNVLTTNIKSLPVRYLYLYKQHPDYKKFITRTSPSAVSLFENEEVHILKKM